MQARLKDLGVKKLPQADIADVVVGDLDGPDTDSGPLLAWRDKSGKLQQSYSAEFHRRNAAAKFARIKELAPRIGAIRSDLVGAMDREQHGTREHASATVAAIIAHTGMRPGSTSSAAAGHFGATTLQAGHVEVSGGTARFTFIGKSGKENKFEVSGPPALVASVARYKAGAASDDAQLFGGASRDSAASRLPSGVKLKDLRTVKATETARAMVDGLSAPPPPLSGDAKTAKRQILAAVRDVSAGVADALNNTPAVAKASYIHPDVFAALERKLKVSPEIRNAEAA